MQNYELSLTIPNFRRRYFFLRYTDGPYFLDYFAVRVVTLDVPLCDDPRYRPCQAVVASVGSVVLYFT